MKLNPTEQAVQAVHDINQYLGEAIVLIEKARLALAEVERSEARNIANNRLTTALRVTEDCQIALCKLELI